MEIIYSRNVNDAYQKGLRRLLREGVEEESRAGPVLVMPTPVVNVYNHPRERVLFDDKRDANPFFHIVEAVWMIAGRRDASLLDRFVADFSSRFAENDGDAHGAYGYRWRNHFGETTQVESGIGVFPEWNGIDQITEAGRLLRENPESRQVVMAMWDPAVDLGAKKRDIPCNDLVMFRAVRNKGLLGLKVEWSLDMSIVARSHDAVWGAYGANIVHMTVMHEVVAALANMEVGVYRHFSNNFHVYKSILPKIGTFPGDRSLAADPYQDWMVPQRICYDRNSAETFIAESEQLCNEFAGGKEFSEPENQWLRDTVIPMMRAHGAYKFKLYDHALHFAEDVSSLDWRTAAIAWIKRRVEKKTEPMGAGV